MFQSARLLVALLFLSILVASYALPVKTLEFHLGAGEISFLAKAQGRGPQIASFSILSSVNDFLQSSLVNDKACALHGDKDIILDNSRSLSDSLGYNHHTVLRCAGKPDITVQPVGHWRDAHTDEVSARLSAYLEKRELKQEQALLTGKTEELREYPFDLIDLSHITAKACLYWSTKWLAHHFGDLHPFQNYGMNGTIVYGTDSSIYDYVDEHTTQDVGIYHLNTGALLSPFDSQTLAVSNYTEREEIRMSMTGDWGSGTFESNLVSDFMKKETDPHYTIHLGDIYFMGAKEEVEANVLNMKPEFSQKGVLWRHGSLGSLAVNSNHDMYARGFGFFDTFLPSLSIGGRKGQKASYFSVENSHWRIIGMDSGWGSFGPVSDNPEIQQPDSLVAWLKKVIKLDNSKDKRGIILLSHHQPLSAFEQKYPLLYNQIADMLGDRQVLWYFGHEHKLSFYKTQTVNGKQMRVIPRCIGIGGFPTDPVAIPPAAREAGLEIFDDRKYELLDGDLNISSPAGFNGFATFKFAGNDLEVSYRTLKFKNGITGEFNDRHQDLNTTNSHEVVRESFTIQAGHVVMIKRDILDKDLTVLTHNAGEDISPQVLAAANIDMKAVSDKMRPGIIRGKNWNNKVLFNPDNMMKQVNKLIQQAPKK